MRISDWSSDVCSSDLLVPGGENDEIEGPAGAALQPDAIRLEGLDILILDQSHFAGDQKIRAAAVEIIATAAGEVFRRPAGAFRIGSALEAPAPQAFEKRALVGARDLGPHLLRDLHHCQRNQTGT